MNSNLSKTYVFNTFTDIPKVKLNDGNYMPKLGLGTWQLKDAVALRSTVFAIEKGIRLIDTATIYNNEDAIGRAISTSHIDRTDFFITSKVWNSDQGFDNTIKACKQSLRKLKLDYIDLYLVHWPASQKRIETYKALEELQKDGLVRSIGVSNFMVKHLEELLSETNVVPAVNQIELHPFNYRQRQDVLDYCHKNNIVIEAYSTLAQGREFDNPYLIELSDYYSKSQAQILIRWAMQKNAVVIPRSSSDGHILENINVFDFVISDRDMDTLDSLNKDLVITMNPDHM